MKNLLILFILSLILISESVDAGEKGKIGSVYIDVLINEIGDDSQVVEFESLKNRINENLAMAGDYKKRNLLEAKNKALVEFGRTLTCDLRRGMGTKNNSGKLSSICCDMLSKAWITFKNAYATSSNHNFDGVYAAASSALAPTVKKECEKDLRANEDQLHYEYQAKELLNTH